MEHLRRLAVVLAALAGTGCAYAGARGRDFADIFRLEGHVGYGLQVHANAGELVHAGVGTSRQWSAGLVYGRLETNTTIEDHLPLSYVWTLLNPEQENLHRAVLGHDGSIGTHRCFILFPGELNPGTVEKDELHYLDIEAGVLAGFVGVEVGFSIGELLDFILGIFKFSESWTFLDIAGDDPPPARERKRLWYPRRKTDTILPPN